MASRTGPVPVILVDEDHDTIYDAANNALRVTVVSGAAGGTSMSDDAAFTVASSSFTPVGGVVTSDSVDAGDGGAFAMLANRQPKVTIYDSSGVEVTSFGGGTQYTEDAAAAANPVGNALIVVREDARAGSLTSTDGDNVALRGNNLGELYVKHTDTIAVTQSGAWDEVGINDSGNSITVDNPQLSVVGGGAEAAAMRVTIASDSTGVLSVDDNGGALTVDNAGTFAVQDATVATNTGASTTALQIIDDWDESDRAKVNPIVGQAGVQGGSGAVTALTQRVVMATDVALPAGTNILGAAVSSGHATAGTGLSTLFDSDADNTAQALKASAGRLYFLEVSNPNAADAWVQIFDLATGSVTVGATTPKLSLFVPAGDGTLDGAMDKSWEIGMHFATAITYACTTTPTGSGDPTTGLILNAGFV